MTPYSAGIDLIMQASGSLKPNTPEALRVPLGFAAQVPQGHVGLLLPRSGVGAKEGLSLNNTMGVIDPDFTGEWCAYLRNRNQKTIDWKRGDRLLQVIITPCTYVQFTVVEVLPRTERGDGGFGSTTDQKVGLASGKAA